MQLSFLHLVASIACACVFLCSGCGSAPVSMTPEEVDLSTESAVTGSKPDTKADRIDHYYERSTNSGQMSASVALLFDANKAIEQQQYAQASSLAERALRIAPNDGEPYFVLAKTYYFQQQLEQARSFLSRAKALAVGNTELLRSIAQFTQRNRDL